MSHPCQLQAHGFVPGLPTGHVKSADSHQAGAPTSPAGSACEQGFVSHTSLGDKVQFPCNCVHTCVPLNWLRISYIRVIKNVYCTKALNICELLCVLILLLIRNVYDWWLITFH